MRRRVTGLRRVNEIARLWRERAPLPELARAFGYELPAPEDAAGWQRLRRRLNTSIKRLRKRHGAVKFPFRWRKSQSLEKAARECRAAGAVPQWALDAARQAGEAVAAERRAS